uniref:Uncharacterized protein n=1 Tax=Romanomermis culicivorax TaxID=13658 RepID=A0A915KAT9_ROMCU
MDAKMSKNNGDKTNRFFRRPSFENCQELQQPTGKIIINKKDVENNCGTSQKVSEGELLHCCSNLVFYANIIDLKLGPRPVHTHMGLYRASQKIPHFKFS